MGDFWQNLTLLTQRKLEKIIQEIHRPDPISMSLLSESEKLLWMNPAEQNTNKFFLHALNVDLT